jgi:hypothetical protein
MIVDTTIIEKIKSGLQSTTGKEIEPINDRTHKIILGEGLFFRISVTNTSILVVFREAFLEQSEDRFWKLLEELAEKVNHFHGNEIYVIEVDGEIHLEYPLASRRPRLS